MQLPVLSTTTAGFSMAASLLCYCGWVWHHCQAPLLLWPGMEQLLGPPTRVATLPCWARLEQLLLDSLGLPSTENTALLSKGFKTHTSTLKILINFHIFLQTWNVPQVC